jgi:hypothetical protein
MTDQTRFMWAGARTIDEIPLGVVSSNARFVFDQPVSVLAGESIEMKEGQFFLVSNLLGFEVYCPLAGKWDR